MSEEHDENHDQHNDHDQNQHEHNQERQEQPATVAVPIMVNNPSAPTQLPKESEGGTFLNRVSVYWLELVIAMIAVSILASVLSYCSYALCSLGSSGGNILNNYGSLWLSASAIVWIPVAFIFYVRARGYELRHKEVGNLPAQRTLAILYQISAILTTIGFAFVAVFSFLTALTQTTGTGETLLTATLPSFIAALIFGVSFTAFLKHPIITRKTFAMVLVGLSVIIVLPTIVMSIVQIRQANAGSQTHTNTQNNYNNNYNNSYNYSNGYNSYSN